METNNSQTEKEIKKEGEDYDFTDFTKNNKLTELNNLLTSENNKEEMNNDLMKFIQNEEKEINTENKEQNNEQKSIKNDQVNTNENINTNQETYQNAYTDVNQPKTENQGDDKNLKEPNPQISEKTTNAPKKRPSAPKYKPFNERKEKLDNTESKKVSKKQEKDIVKTEKEKLEEEFYGPAKNYKGGPDEKETVIYKRENTDINSNDFKKEKNTKYYSIADLEANPKKKIRINSPHSLYSMKVTGNNIEELYYVPFDRFCIEHPETLKMNKEEQKIRYDFYEKMRLDKINQICKFRNELIFKEKQEEQNENMFKREQSFPLSIQEKENNLKKELLLMKKKYDKELANLVKFELDKGTLEEEMAKQNEKFETEYNQLNSKSLNCNKTFNKTSLNRGKSVTNVDLDGKFLIAKTESNFQKSHNNLKSAKSGLRSGVPASAKHEALLSAKARELEEEKKKKYIKIEQGGSLIENQLFMLLTKRQIEYDLKQKKIEKKLDRIERVNLLKSEEISNKIRRDNYKANKVLERNMGYFMDRQENIKNRYNKWTETTNEFLKNKEMEHLQRIEENKQKEIAKKEYIKQLSRIEMYQRIKLFNNILLKQSVIENRKRIESDLVSDYRNKLNILEIEREKNIKNVTDIFKDGVNKKNVEKLRQRFPDNEQIKNEIDNYEKKMKEIQETENNKENKRYSRLSTLSGKSKTKYKIKESQKETPKEKKKLSEKEILDKVKEFKKSKKEKFLVVLENEKKEEAERKNRLENAKSEEEKEKMEKEFGNERTEAFLRLKQEKEKMEKEIEQFEKDIRKNNEMK